MARSDSGRFGSTRRRTTTGAFDIHMATQALSDLEETDLTGSLLITNGRADVAFLFTQGALRVIGSGRTLPTLRERLVEAGQLKPKDAAKVDRVMAGDDREPLPPGVNRRSERDLIVHLSALNAEPVDTVARQVISEVFLDALFWEDAHAEVSTGAPDPDLMRRRGLTSLAMTIGTRDLLKEIRGGMRNTVDLRRALPDMQALVTVTDDGKAKLKDGSLPGEDALAGALFEQLEAAGGKARVEALIANLDAGELRLASRLHKLSEGGALKIQRRARSRADQLALLQAMSAEVDEALNPALRHQHIAQAAAAAGDSARAARHHARAGWTLLESGRADDALGSFREALKIAADDLEAREGYVQSLWDLKRDAEAAADTAELARIQNRLGLHGRARRALERALNYGESTDLLDALVVTWTRAGKPQRAAEVGERLVNRLKQEGRGDEAIQAAQHLLTLGDAGSQKRLMRAAGLDRRKAVALLVVGGLFALGFLPVKAEEAARADFAASAVKIQAGLNANHDLSDMPELLGELTQQVQPSTQSSSEDVSKRAREVVEELNFMRADCSAADQIYPHLPWRDQPDIEHVHSVVHRLEVYSEAFRGPMNRLKGELDAYVQSAQKQAGWLGGMRATDEAYQLATSMRTEYAAMPELLRRTALSVRLETDPPGARVVYHGTSYIKRTPLQIRVPLLGSRDLALTLPEHERVQMSVDLDALEGEPRLVVKLTPESTSPTSPGNVTSSGRDRPAKRPPPQVMFKDGYFLSGRDKRYKFEQVPRHFDEGRWQVRIPARFRAVIRGLNRIERGQVQLVAFDVLIYARRSGGWYREHTTRHELDDPLRRPVVALRNGDRRVRAFTQTLRLDLAELCEDLKEEVNDGVKAIVNRERGQR
jgi:tetratricopeptide (TPR) repeat protein